MFSFSGLTSSKKPIGSFLLLGSTGLGKTHTAKMIAQTLFEREDNLIQLDMSEFSEKTSVSKLTGSAPGYVGYEEGSQLIERVKRNPYCVIVFDEIEKAHDDVLNLLLQILEEGKLTGNMGQSADFSNAIIVLTSNIGQEFYQKTSSIGFMPKEDTPDTFKKSIINSAKKHFKLELLNRIDSIIPYNQLQIKELRQVLNIKIKEFQKQLKKKGVNLKVSAQVRVDICKRAVEENMGARPLQRIFRDEVQTICARKILEDQELKEISFCLKDKLVSVSEVAAE
jgi:ATP-dependent Clp protease ATP-binding subunit ClpA